MIVAMLLSSLLGGVIAIGGYRLITPEQVEYIPTSYPTQASFTNYSIDTSGYIVPEGMNFVYAAENSVNSVVHIRTQITEGASSSSANPFDEYFRDFFGQPDRGRRPSRGMGSGVIVESSGYIVTNYHVVDGASEVEVMLNDNRTYDAEIIGVDPTTDIAVLKVEALDLPAMKWGSSDNVSLGEWVLAVGNPFDFRSTVTAGIVSAKARNINILRERNNLQIESFIQTDAAVNPGNSGGALVNLNGELVGINTAIISPTGAFAGYSFAVPVSLVKKVYEDLTEYGEVQRALIGVRINDVNADIAERYELNVLQGVFISSITSGSAAEEAGLESEDVIIAVDGRKVNSSSELQELIALRRPGDQVTVSYIRNGKAKDVRVTLRNSVGTTDIVTRSSVSFSLNGATFENVSDEELKTLGLSGGVKVADVSNGKFRETGIKRGFIITKVDKTPIQDVEQFKLYLESSRGEGVLIEGIYPDGEKAYYGVGW